MEKIRKNGLEKVINRHKAECSKIQPIVNTMLETGFCFTTDESERFGIRMFETVQTG